MRRASLCLVAFVAGCGWSGGPETIDEARLDELVLQDEDVGAGFRRTWISNLGGRPIARVQYRRGALTIDSTTSLLPTDDAADDHLETTREALRRRRSWQPIAEPGLGQESFAATVLQSGVRHYDVHWREANATASLSVTAAEDALPLADVLELARDQQRRLESAAD